MKADLVAREPQRLEQWAAEKLYERIQAARVDAKKFVLHDGPPFANGEVHIGTALNKILKDFIIKYKSLRGFSAPYVPGWDCHGLPIEFKVSQEMRQAGDAAADAATIRRACDAYARKFIDLQRVQFKRLGILGDWNNPYLTLHKEYEADELRLFADLVEKGLVYRGKKPVYWSIPCRTALAEAEVEYKDHVSQSSYVKFPVVGMPGTFVLIWTTTPWTLPANLAIAYNSTFSYSLVRVREEFFIASTLLLSTLMQKCGWDSYEIVRSLDADQLRQIEFEHPFCARRGKLFPGDSFVTNDTGTGFVHIAPGHGLDDYLLGMQNNLAIYSPVDDDGRFAYTDDLPREQQMPESLIGKSILEKNGRSEANEAVLEILQSKNALVHREDYSHSYPHCWRSKTPIIFRAMDQWFIEIDHAQAEGEVTAEGRVTQIPIPSAPVDKGLAELVPPVGKTFRQQALAEIDRVRWIPQWGVNRIKGAVETRPDWCISRQRSWGVPIPAFYDANKNAILDAQIVRHTADLVEQHGSNVWFEKSAGELWAQLKPKGWTGAEAVSKSNDTLDVWIDSGSSSRTVLMRRRELLHGAGPGENTARPWQADMYLEGSDQHRGWFQSSLLLSLAGNGAAPYQTVLTHGFMVDADRDKISKSKQGQGTYEKPQTSEAYVKKYGADVVRLWVASQDFRTDIVVSDERINKVSETYRGLRNTLRYQLSNLYDFDPAQHTVADEKLTGLDRWVLGAFSKMEKEVIEAYERYEFHVVYQTISQFVAVELSSIYHDVVKDRLYTDAANSPRRRSTQTALHRMVTGLCQMLAPILVFTTDEAWEFVPGKKTPSVHESVMTSANFSIPVSQVDYWKTLFELRETVLQKLEARRQRKHIGKSLEAFVTIVWGKRAPLASAFETLGRNPEPLRELLNVSAVEMIPDSANPETADFAIDVLTGRGQKCERCWHWETDVGSDPAHPTICARCVGAVKGLV